MPARAGALSLLTFVTACASASPPPTPTRPAPSPPRPSPSAPTTEKQTKPAVDGTLDPNMVANEVRSHLAAVKQCYQRALQLDPSIAGKVVLHWTISTDGTVSALKIEENTFSNGNLAACVVDVVSRWQFPAPEGGTVDVSFPFVFRSTP